MPPTSGDSDWVAPVVPLFGRDDRPARADRPHQQEDEPARDPSENHPARSAERRAKRAQNVSVAALTRRGMSVAELRDTLAQRGVDENEAEAEIERLTEGRYLDDVRLAESVVRTETERKGKGRSAVVAELRRRRVADEAIEEVLDDFDDEDERRLAVSVAEKRVRQLSSLDPETARRRLAGFLQRRGFSGAVVQHAVRTVLPAQSRGSVVFVESDD